MPLTKATFKELVSSDDLPVGYFRNGIPFSVGTSQASVPIVPSSGATDTTSFSAFYVPTNGTYEVRYLLTSYTSGNIQEAIFEYKPDLLGVGQTIINQNWTSPSISTRIISDCIMKKGIYWLCLRASNGSSSIGASCCSRTTTASSIAGSPDIGFSVNNFPLNGSGFSLGFSSALNLYQYLLWDNSTTPNATQINYNGTLSDFSPYQNIQSRYYLYPTATTLLWKIGLKRTG
jgi:hypothetical protein